MVKANAKTRSIRRRGTLAKKLLRDLRENHTVSVRNGQVVSVKRKRLRNSNSRISLRTLLSLRSLRTGRTCLALRTRCPLTKHKSLWCTAILTDGDDIACISRYHCKSWNIACFVGVQRIRYTQQLLGGPYRVVGAAIRVNAYI